MPPSTTLKNKDAERVLDKSEGVPSQRGAPMHSRERHADKSDAELIARFNNNFRVWKAEVSTFKSPGDQNAALSAYFKTSDGKRDLERIKSSKKKERINLETYPSGRHLLPSGSRKGRWAFKALMRNAATANSGR